jgi:UDP-N-acetylglucosamine--N-acetylmuramyl-(pentapeptide) pyrophosphoryl-undecaprenol N-acetylglucosamine transferase
MKGRYAVKILLTGGGTGGHITPLLAVARELKAAHPDIILVAVCEKKAPFVDLYVDEPVIDSVRQISAGKLRRYGGQSLLRTIFDVRTNFLNFRDVFSTAAGYFQAKKMLEEERPDGIIFKGGFIGVPVGKAAARLGIPYITHDSDTVPGLANRLIAKKAVRNATGMPAEFYGYPEGKKVFTGVPISKEYKHISHQQMRAFRTELGLGDCRQTITVIGASSGAEQLNNDILSIAGRLMQNHEGLGILHITGRPHEQAVIQGYARELLADERKRVVVQGFVNDAHRYVGASDVVISRASATVMAELAVQGKPTIMVPGMLAGDHQTVNAQHMSESKAVLYVKNADAEGLYEAIHTLLTDHVQADELAEHLHAFAKPHAARELAELAVATFAKDTHGVR